MQTDPTERPIDTLTVAALAVCLATPETGAPFAALREALTDNGREPTEWPALIEAVRDHTGDTIRFAEAVEAWVGPFAWLEPKVRAIAEAALACVASTGWVCGRSPFTQGATCQRCGATPGVRCPEDPARAHSSLRAALTAIGASTDLAAVDALLALVAPHVTDLGAFGLAVERWAAPEPGAPGWWLREREIVDGNGYGPDRYSEQA